MSAPLAASSVVIDAPASIGSVDAARRLEQGGLYAEGERHWRQALACAATEVEARRGLVLNLLRQGRRNAALSALRCEVATEDGLRWMQRLVATAISGPDVGFAGELASALAALRWGSRWYPRSTDTSVTPDTIPDAGLSVAKLSHDIEQFSYLRQRGVVGPEFDATIAAYRVQLERLFAEGPDSRSEMDEAVRAEIGDVYNRIVYIAPTPRVGRALSTRWDAEAIESAYLREPPGLAVIDDFLSEDALAGLRRFCLESTIWSSVRHAHGRLGSQFQNGFCAPLVMQIGEELLQAFPRLIGHRYPLRHIWGYKSPPVLPADVTTHADFAAVNVNLWITPEEANLDPSSGGLVVYGVDAPLHWDFDTYNAKRLEAIEPYLRRHNVRAVHIPYRANRAIVFNADLFHATEAVRFRPEYEFRRTNITYLFGDREADRDHLGLAQTDGPAADAPSVPAWRSAAFKKARLRRG